MIARGPSQRRPPCPLTSGFRHARRRGVRRQAGPRRTRPVCSSRPLRRCGDGSAGGGAYSLAGEHRCESEELSLVERGGLALYSGLLKIDGNSSHWSCGENYPLRFAEIEQEYGMIGPCGLGPILLEIRVAGTLKPKIRRCYFFGSTSQLYLKYWKNPTTTATTLAVDPPMQLSPGLRLVLCEACALSVHSRLLRSMHKKPG